MGTCYLMKGRENAARPYRAEWFDYYRKPGKRVKGGSQTFATEREGNRWWQDMEADNAAFYGREGRSRATSRKLGEYAQAWADGLTLSHNTRVSYRRQAKALAEYFGPDMLVSAITKPDVKAMVADMANAQGLKAGTVKVRMNVLNHIIEAAIDDGIRKDNPTRGVARPAETEHVARILTAEEMGTVVANLPECYRAPVMLAYYGGLRISEVCGLRTHNVDLLHSRITVQHVRHGDGTEGDHPKGRKVQPVALAAPLAKALREHFDAFPPAPNGYVFRSRTNPDEGLTQNELRYQFRKACKAANLPGETARFHDLRHSCATAYAESGAPAYVIQEMLRHGRLDTSQRYIGKVSAEQMQTWADRVHDAV